MKDDSLRTVALRVKQLYPHARVILFGSTLAGTGSKDSDVDLCIVIENPNERLRDISRKIRKEICPLLNRSLDILAYDKKTFDDRAALPVTMEAEISEHGKEL